MTDDQLGYLKNLVQFVDQRYILPDGYLELKNTGCILLILLLEDPGSRIPELPFMLSRMGILIKNYGVQDRETYF